MKKEENKNKNRKSIKISELSHKNLLDYCTLNGLKINKFVEKLIKENCKEK